MLTFIKKLFGCNTKQKPIKRKSAKVGMSKKDWAKEDAHLNWINSQASAALFGRRVMVSQPKRKTHSQALNEVILRHEKALRMVY